MIMTTESHPGGRTLRQCERYTVRFLAAVATKMATNSTNNAKKKGLRGGNRAGLWPIAFLSGHWGCQLKLWLTVCMVNCSLPVRDEMLHR